MKLTKNDICVFEALARYYALSTPQIRRVCFPHIRDGRAIRRRLARLVANQFIGRSETNVAFATGNSGPAYYLTSRGVEALAVYYGDDAWYATNTRKPRLDRLYHWLEISETHWIVDQAVAASPDVELVEWINEWQPTLDGNGNPTGYVLHTQFRDEPLPLSCSPDAAFLLQVGEHRRVVYVEVDRGTSGARRVAASKTPGFAELARTHGHCLHFPTTTFKDFSVLLVTVSAEHRDRIRAEVAKQTDHRPDLWLFASHEEFTPENMLYAPIMHDYLGQAGPLLSKPPVSNQPSRPAQASASIDSREQRYAN